MDIADVYAAPGHLIRRAQQIAVAIFFDEFRDWDVTPVQFAALVAIKDRPGMDQRTLVNCIAIDRSTVGSMLRVLEERRMISRVTPKENMRIKRLYIEPAGEKILDETRDAIRRAQERILAPLKADEQEIFMKYLARIVDLNNELSRAPLRIHARETMPDIA
nr:MarR family transcriptional regulator [Rhizobium sp. P28RR-XV]